MLLTSSRAILRLLPISLCSEKSESGRAADQGQCENQSWHRASTLNSTTRGLKGIDTFRFREAGAGGSNPLTPTNLQRFASCSTCKTGTDHPGSVRSPARAFTGCSRHLPPHPAPFHPLTLLCAGIPHFGGDPGMRHSGPRATVLACRQRPVPMPVPKRHESEPGPAR